MALNKTNLKNSLQALFLSPPATRSACAAAWAAAYASYAAGGVSCQGVNGTLTGREAALSSALDAALANTNPGTTASAMDAAFVAFWTGVLFAGITAGTAAVAPGTLTAALPTMWAANVAGAFTAAQAAQAHADTLDTFTRTVVVTHAPPSACGSTLA
jgi:hypothetical protein